MWAQDFSFNFRPGPAPYALILNQRDSDRDRFFFVEQRAFLGVRRATIPFVLQWRFEAGRAFNRRAYEARAFSEQKKHFTSPSTIRTTQASS
jgi:hypothetical protein